MVKKKSGEESLENLLARVDQGNVFRRWGSETEPENERKGMGKELRKERRTQVSIKWDARRWQGDESQSGFLKGETGG